MTRHRKIHCAQRKTKKKPLKSKEYQNALSAFLLVAAFFPMVAHADEYERITEPQNRQILIQGGSDPIVLREPSCEVVTSTFDIDVPRVQITGSFTINNAAPLADSAQSGRIELRHDTLGTVDLGAVHTGDYTRYIIPGVYDVVYRHTDGDILPQNAETILLNDVDLTASGTFDIAIESVLVLGDITLDGATPPIGSYENGQIRFRDRTTGATFPVGVSKDGQYFAMVIPGEYDILYSRLIGDSVVPLNGASVLIEEVTVAGLTETDVDIPTVLRTGDILIDGELAPSGLYENGRLFLRDTQSGDVFAFGQTREQAYSARVVAGVYDVIYARLIGGSMVPANTFAVVASGLDFTSDGDLDIDITTITVVGDLTLDGAAFPTGSYNRAQFWLQGSQEGDVFAIGTTREARYEVRIVPGRYDLIYKKLSSTGQVPENPWSVVSSGHRLATRWGMDRPQITFDIDIITGWLGADVTVWGEAPLTGIYENGLIWADDGMGAPIALGETRDGGGSALVLAAPYDVRYSHLIGDTVPFNGDAQVAEGESEPVSMPLAVDLQPGSLSGDFSQNALPFPGNPMHRGRLLLRDMETGDAIELAHTASGGYDRTLLGGTYEVIYEHVLGLGVVTNEHAVLGCITFDPPAPSLLERLPFGSDQLVLP